ncbi:MAG: aminoglycoside phosphotransferase family protein [Patescibacteria group bacterium]
MKNLKAFKRVKSKKYMLKFFAGIVKEFFPPGTRLKDLKIIDLSRFEFKKSLKYKLILKTPVGKTDIKIIRGNAPSSDTPEEIKIADASQKILYRKGFAFTPFHVPLSLGFYPKINLVLYEDYPGLPFDEYIKKKPKDLLYLTKQAALWLARFHELKIQKGKVRTAMLAKKEIGFFKDDYKNNYPGIYALGSTILENLWPLFEKHVFPHKDEFRLTHGDFNPQNIIVNKNSIGVIDWGRSCLFDPVSDLGNLIAQMNLIHWRRNFDLPTVTRVKKVFIDTYLEARNLKFKEIKQRFLLHELWWIMQIIAYTVSVYTSPEAINTIFLGLKKAKEICRTLNISAGGNIDLNKKKNYLSEVFADKDVMMKFYNKNLKDFFPVAKNIVALEITHSKALSQTSFLTRTKFEVVNYNENKIIHYIRGNVVSPQTYKIFKFVHEHRKIGPLSPRPLFYFNNVHYILYEETPGVKLREFGFKDPSFPLILKKIAQSLAKLHNLPLPLISRTNKEEPDLFADLKNKIRHYDAKNYPRYKKYLGQYLGLIKKKLAKKRRVISHNDFQASNILVTPEKNVAIIDYSLSSLFYPAFDVANFITHLEIMLDRIIAPQKIRAWQNLFFQNYLKEVKKVLAKEVEDTFPLLRVRSALDIWAITVTLMGPKDKNRQRYVEKLINIIENNLK